MRIANWELHSRVELKILLIIETMHACILNKEEFRVPDQIYGGYGHSWCHEWCFFTPRRYPENFVLISQLEVCQKGGYLKDVEGSWQETWMTGSTMMFLMYWVDPMDHMLKVLWHFLYFWLKYKHLKKRDQNVIYIQTDRHTNKRYSNLVKILFNNLTKNLW